MARGQKLHTHWHVQVERKVRRTLSSGVSHIRLNREYANECALACHSATHFAIQILFAIKKISVKWPPYEHSPYILGGPRQHNLSSNCCRLSVLYCNARSGNLRRRIRAFLTKENTCSNFKGGSILTCRKVRKHNFQPEVIRHVAFRQILNCDNLIKTKFDKHFVLFHVSGSNLEAFWEVALFDLDLF